MYQEHLRLEPIQQPYHNVGSLLLLLPLHPSQQMVCHRDHTMLVYDAPTKVDVKHTKVEYYASTQNMFLTNAQARTLCARLQQPLWRE